MRVLIRVDAGEQHGLGHFVRMQALAARLQQQGAEVEYVSATPQTLERLAEVACWDAATIMALVRGFDCLVIDTKATDWANDRYALQDMQDNWMDVVRLDHPHATPDTCSLLVGPVAHWLPAEVERLRAAFGERFLYGWDYVMLPEEVTHAQPIPYGKRRHRIVCCAGGSDAERALPQMYAWTHALVLKSQEAVLELVFALPESPALAEYPPLCWRSMASILTPFRRQLLRSASLVVGFIGQTMYECLWYHTPQLVFARTADDVQRLDILAEMSRGALMNGGLWPMQKATNFCSQMTKLWQDVPARVVMAHASTGLLNGQGVARIADAILALKGKAHE